MAYRGEDLDLRTLQSWTSQGRDMQDLFTAGPVTGSLRSRPIYVDDTVMACLNDAYELAVAHRSGEIRLEHLLNAMTRVEAATKIMELAGVRVTTLRRETGTIIASDLPVAYTNGKTTPRTGTDVEDVLRLAAERAYTRRQTVAVDDLLDVLAEASRDTPAVALLRRHWNGRPIMRESLLPPLARTVADEPRERIRVQARPVYTPEPPRADVQQVMTDTLQNTRIENLERLVRQLSDEHNVERKGMAQLFTDIQRELGSSREDATRFRGNLANQLKSMERTVADVGSQSNGSTPQMLDRLMAVERSLEARFTDLARTWSALGEKLQALEYNVSQVRIPDGALRVDMKPVERQFTEISRTLSTVSDRLAQIERNPQGGPAVDMKPVERQLTEMSRTLGGLTDRLTQIERQPARGGTVSMEPVIDRISQLERAVQGGMGEGARNWAQMGERMKLIETRITQRPTADVNLAPIAERLEQIERALAARPVGGQAVSLTPVLDRMVQLERQLDGRSAEQSRMVTGVAERLRGLEENFGAQRASVAEIGNRLGLEIKALGSTLGAGRVEADRQQASMAERVQTLVGSFDRQRGEIVQAVAQPVTERMTQAVARLEQQNGQTTEGVRQMLGELMAQVGQRLGGLESNLAQMRERNEQVGQTRDKDLGELHEALIKINANQQTLATALDQWRLDTAGDISVLSNRLEALEHQGEAPARQMQQLTAEVQSMHALQLRREARKSRFRMWLFGTEDWFGDSWERRDQRTAADVVRVGAAQPTADPGAGGDRPTAFRFLRR